MMAVPSAPVIVANCGTDRKFAATGSCFAAKDPRFPGEGDRVKLGSELWLKSFGWPVTFCDLLSYAWADPPPVDAWLGDDRCARVVPPAAAQVRSSFGAKSVGGLSSLGGGDDASDPATVTSQFTAATKDRPAVLMITVKIEPGWHVYSITQPAGGPQRAKIEVTPSPQFRLIGPFGSFPEPTKHIDQVAWVGLELQEHENQVTWYAPIELAAGVDPAKVEIDGSVKLQVCKESCVPVNTTFAARLGTGVPIGPIKIGDSDSTKTASVTSPGAYQAEGSEVKWTGHLEPAIVQPGGTANIVLTATPASGWHLYAWSPRDDGHGSKPTLITLSAGAGAHDRAADDRCRGQHGQFGARVRRDAFSRRADHLEDSDHGGRRCQGPVRGQRLAWIPIV